MAEDRELKGILIPNVNQRTEDDPNYRGYATVDGVNYVVSAWDRQNAKGKFLRLNFKLKPNMGKEK